MSLPLGAAATRRMSSPSGSIQSASTLYSIVWPCSIVTAALRTERGGSLRSSGRSVTCTWASATPPGRPSVIVYRKVTVPRASGAGVSCSARPPSIVESAPQLSGIPEVSETVSTSPSGSESLSSTGSTVEEPGRTPNWSSRASGGRFCSVRSARVSSKDCVADFSSPSSVCSCSGGVTSSQFCTRAMFESTSQESPVVRLLRAMTERLTRNSSRLPLVGRLRSSTPTLPSAHEKA